MNITTQTATTLGQKLAALELSDEEGTLLAELLAQRPEVEGFGRSEPNDPRIMFETFRTQNLPQVLGPLPGAWKVKPDGYVVTQDLQD